MTRWTMGMIAGILLLATCGPTYRVESVINKMRTFTDLMCKCTDRECADQVDKDRMSWALKNMEMLEEAERNANAEQKERAAQLDEQYEECSRKARGEETVPTEPPPAPVDAGPPPGN